MPTSEAAFAVAEAHTAIGRCPPSKSCEESRRALATRDSKRANHHAPLHRRGAAGPGRRGFRAHNISESTQGNHPKKVRSTSPRGEFLRPFREMPGGTFAMRVCRAYPADKRMRIDSAAFNAFGLGRKQRRAGTGKWVKNPLRTVRLSSAKLVGYPLRRKTGALPKPPMDRQLHIVDECGRGRARRRRLFGQQFRKKRQRHLPDGRRALDFGIHIAAP